eukprot:CAMPEP_0181332026 /NCGR_PEP_ID=MMETSP1101-20121128/24848_1 /TAXON_ID=46948 /ORGANISM="Rhodomonas abbreviata, Strain Caron Lab Isolate" /LENGTH=104 /DNA_ID=CAMNT_0023441591 /DNA_START=345 /DNA_END=659 /DNA_ORIENTATION=+
MVTLHTTGATPGFQPTLEITNPTELIGVHNLRAQVAVRRPHRLFFELKSYLVTTSGQSSEHRHLAMERMYSEPVLELFKRITGERVKCGVNVTLGKMSEIIVES